MVDRDDLNGAGEGELLEQAIGNAIAMYTATRAFLEEKGIDPAELDSFFGQTHAPGWAEARGDIGKVAHYVALNLRTFGFDTEVASEVGTVTVTARWSQVHDDPDWPIPVRPALAQSARSFDPIMSWLGIGFTREVSDEGIVLRLAV